MRTAPSIGGVALALTAMASCTAIVDIGDVVMPDADVDGADVPDQAEGEDDTDATETDTGTDTSDDTDAPRTIDCSVDKLCERCTGTWETAIEPAAAFPLTIDGEGENSYIVVSGGCEYTAGPGAWFHDCDPTGRVVILVDSGFGDTFHVHIDATCEVD